MAQVRRLQVVLALIAISSFINAQLSADHKGNDASFGVAENLQADHTEAIQIVFDPSQISYENLLEIFWALHDPTEKQPRQYRSVIFVHNEKQRQLALESLNYKENNIQRKVETTVENTSQFFDAEGYHQKYMLRQNRVLMQHFQDMSDEEFMNSFVAARLNGLVGGYAKPKWIKKELTDYKLSHPDAFEQVEQLLNVI